MTKEFIIKHFSYRLSKDESYYYINLIFEPIDDYLKTWCKQEAADYIKSSIIVDLEAYKKEAYKPNILYLVNINKHFEDLHNKYYFDGWKFQNNILQQLNPPFATTYRFCEYFTKNKIVDACIETINLLKVKEDSLGQDLINCINSLKYHWD